MLNLGIDEDAQAAAGSVSWSRHPTISIRKYEHEKKNHMRAPISYIHSSLHLHDAQQLPKKWEIKMKRVESMFLIKISYVCVCLLYIFYHCIIIIIIIISIIHFSVSEKETKIIRWEVVNKINRIT